MNTTTRLIIIASLISALTIVINSTYLLNQQYSQHKTQEPASSSFLYRIYNYKALTRASPKTEPTQNLKNKRIAISIQTTDDVHYFSITLQKTIDSLRDTCDSGAIISLIIYTNRPYPVEIINLINSRVRCRNSIGKFDIEIKLVDFTSTKQSEQYNRENVFRKHLNDFDLFIYAEDHIHVKLRHIFSYFIEIENLKELLPKEQFADYTIGFFRYGIDKIKNQQMSCDEFHTVSNEILSNKYIATKSLNNIYMATPHQVRLWKNRCTDQSSAKNNNIHGYKESTDNPHMCNITHIIPSDYFEDFTVLDTAYKFPDSTTITSSTTTTNNPCLTSFQLQRARLTLFETDTIQKRFVNENGVYNGITLEVDETEQMLNEATISNKAYISELQKVMRQYEEYVSNGGKFCEGNR